MASGLIKLIVPGLTLDDKPISAFYGTYSFDVANNLTIGEYIIPRTNVASIITGELNEVYTIKDLIIIA